VDKAGNNVILLYHLRVLQFKTSHFVFGPLMSIITGFNRFPTFMEESQNSHENVPVVIAELEIKETVPAVGPSFRVRSSTALTPGASLRIRHSLSIKQHVFHVRPYYSHFSLEPPACKLPMLPRGPGRFAIQLDSACVSLLVLQLTWRLE
jgi:hypothetical protein